MRKIGLALGGGGARGLAHIPMLEVFDELGIRPHRISGTSIGAVMGALYASGHSGSQIREIVRKVVITKGDSFREALHKREALKSLGFFDLQFRRTGLFKGDKFMAFLYEAMKVRTFGELQIPLTVVATDFYTSGQVILKTGDLLDAVKASMGLPGVFAPVVRDGRVLIDGGGVNPVPFDVLDDCDLVVAVDVMGEMAGDGDEIPNMVRAVLGTFDIMQKSIIAEKLKRALPAVYIKPKVVGVDLLEFYKANEIYQHSGPARAELKKALELVLKDN